MEFKISSEVLSRTGEIHKKAGTGNQDSVNVISNGQYTYVIMSDGAGSAEFAAKASRITVNTASSFCFFNGDDGFDHCNEFARRLVLQIQINLNSGAEALGAAADDMLCTFILLAIDNEKKRYFSMHIGDGLIAENKKGRWSVLSYPENGASKQYSYFVNSPDSPYHSRIKKGIFTCGDKFFVSTDGYFENCRFSRDFIERIESGITYCNDDVTYCKILTDGV